MVRWEGWSWKSPSGVTHIPYCHPQLVVESSAQRVIHLAGQWEKHRVPLVAEYRHLRKLQDCREVGCEALGCGWGRFSPSLGAHPCALLTIPLPMGSWQLESSRRLAEIQELHQSVRAAAEEARRKEEVYKQLVRPVRGPWVARSG